MGFKTIIGLALVAAGAILSIFFWDLEFYWFQGGPLGLLLILIGVLDLGDEFRRSRGHKPKSLFEDIKDDIGFGGRSSGSGDRRDDRDR
ncbi:hypothetical protein [Nocardiopsis chromatogenes]|uniref:hypothetical protein n=1 Tax=Nocardiopsis chromatogenes TaxID=280239 RepID=UPI00034836CA|nr:hypothetical protein [Nocardiopsis chromatogenes]